MRPADDDRTLLRALDAALAHTPHRAIGEAVLGPGRMADWYRDGSLRAQVRRRIEKARFLMEVGYRDLAAGRRLRSIGPWRRSRKRR